MGKDLLSLPAGRINFMRNAKRSTNRDFKIKLGAQKEKATPEPEPEEVADGEVRTSNGILHFTSGLTSIY